MNVELSSSLPVGSRAANRRGFYTTLGAIALLLLASLIWAPSSLSSGAVAGMLPFAAVLAVVGLGQMLVVQQAGFDLSAPGSISLSVVLIAYISYGDDSKIPLAIGVAFLCAIGAGLLNALLIGWLNLSAIIATLGTNALLMGIILGVSGGVPRSSSGSISAFTNSSVLGIPNSAIVAILVVALVGLVLKKTAAGRRFEAVGASSSVMKAAGVQTRVYKGAAYVGAQLLYAVAGTLLVGIVAQPTAYLGNSYLLPSVAVVVLAGTALSGGKGFPVATSLAALFLTQLNQFTLALGVTSAAQTLVQAFAFGVGVAIYSVDWKRLIEKLPGVARENRAVPAPV
ncbi:ABC transporter permease [Leucobacter sp. W1038]|uniref:ABC transporter permease n=1 Tax=Leucobacter sp. W1038 TaxID=3438281 RepID=UPI003D959A1B